MKITFVAIGCEQLGVSLLASLLEAQGHQVGLAFNPALFDDRYALHLPLLARWFDDTGAVLGQIRDQRPDVLAFSAITNTYDWMIQVATRIKAERPEVVVVFGGPHPSAVPEVVLDSGVVDYLCVGEAERALPALIARLAAGGVDGELDSIWFRRPDGALVRGRVPGFFADLDSLPPFDKKLWEDHIRVGDLYMTMTSRGCPYRCTYCHNSYYRKLPDPGVRAGRYLRRRSADHVLGELRAAKRRYQLRCVDFVDDIFTTDRRWLRPFLERYRREIGVPFNCLGHAQHVDDEVAGWLHEAGCEWVQIGIQTVDDDYKRRALGRRETLVEIERALAALARHHIRVKADHIFGLPGEPPENQLRAAAVYAEMTPDRISTFWATYFPATEMTRQAVALGILDQTDVAAIARGQLSGYHDRGTVDADQVAMLRRCELWFRLLPLLPRRLRRSLGPGALAAIPADAAWLLGLAADTASGLRQGNRDHVSYAAHYLHHGYRHLRTRLGLPAPAATQPRTG